MKLENTNIIRLDTFIVFYDYKLEYIILINCKIKKKSKTQCVSDYIIEQ